MVPISLPAHSFVLSFLSRISRNVGFCACLAVIWSLFYYRTRSSAQKWTYRRFVHYRTRSSAQNRSQYGIVTSLQHGKRRDDRITLMNTEKRYFGTDGVRGVANKELTCQMAFCLGETAVQVLGRTLVIGRDTRVSGSMLEAALVAGITSRGGTALLAGVIPTPAVAFLVQQEGADGGVVISASHNPPEYNGIKFFDSQGYKLSEEKENQLEAGLQTLVTGELSGNSTLADTTELPTGVEVGQAVPLLDACDRYIKHAVSVLEREQITLKGLKVALDCGNGAAHYCTPQALKLLGAEVFVINDEGKGAVINVASGSTDLTQLKELVLSNKADVGIAHDGDADRTIAVSESGQEIDGDYIEAICALDRKATRGIPGNTIVSTVMCNIGFVQAMEEAGLRVLQTPVGDTNVLAAMREGGYAIGGEQSGHMIFIEHNTTGDGLVTALMLLAAMQRNKKSLDVLAEEAMKKYPQTLINVKVSNKEALDTSEALQAAIQASEAELKESGGGRVLIRASGTEPLVRVMVEAATKDTADAIATQLAHVVETELAA